jgi:imidazole glycerol-phosphate synthase subunit HisH
MTGLVALIDYGSGNLTSAAKALARAAATAEIGQAIEITSDPKVIAKAERIVLPGVGAFAACFAGLTSLTGMQDALTDAVLKRGRPFLGICVGMQLMAERGLEHGTHAGLGWLPGEIAPLQASEPTMKIPHMGWNTLTGLAPHPVLAGLEEGAHMYFVHSYAWRGAHAAHIRASCDYGGRFPAVIGRDNLIGTQFHPEKSQTAGLRLLANWLQWRP